MCKDAEAVGREKLVDGAQDKRIVKDWAHPIPSLLS